METVKADRINHLARVPLDDSGDKMRCDNHHPVDDMEPVRQTEDQRVQAGVAAFVNAIMRLGMLERDIVCRRALGETWGQIVEAHALRSIQVAENRFRRALRCFPDLATFFGKTNEPTTTKGDQE